MNEWTQGHPSSTIVTEFSLLKQQTDRIFTTHQHVCTETAFQLNLIYLHKKALTTTNLSQLCNSFNLHSSPPNTKLLLFLYRYLYWLIVHLLSHKFIPDHMCKKVDLERNGKTYRKVPYWAPLYSLSAPKHMAYCSYNSSVYLQEKASVSSRLVIPALLFLITKHITYATTILHHGQHDQSLAAHSTIHFYKQ